MSRKNKIHGMRETRIYNIWRSMKLRCRVPSNTAYRYYGARGIDYDDHWEDFINFLEDVGLPPTAQHSLERIDPKGDYCKANCKWADKWEQARNRRNIRKILVGNELLTRTEIARKFNLKSDTVCYYFRKGKTLSEILKIYGKSVDDK